MNNTAVVTGGSRGLGLALASQLAREGWTIITDARNGDDLKRAIEDIERDAPGATVHGLPGDVTDPAHRAELVHRAEDTGRLDLLVNNASVLGPSPQPGLADYPLDVLAGVLATNVVAPLGLVQLALPLLIRAHGVIVNVTSDAAVEPYEGWGGYGSSKAALDQLSNVLAAEQPELRVYAFDPGDMRTQMHQEAFPGEDISDRPDPSTVVPALGHLLTTRPPSGRYRAADLTAPVTP